MMPNTCIEYLYRDASNWKTHNLAIIPGKITPEQIDRIMACLQQPDGTFVPEKVGLPADRWVEYDPDRDHRWCELYRTGFHPTGRKPEPDGPKNAEELTARFEAMRERWEDPTAEFDWQLKLPPELEPDDAQDASDDPRDLQDQDPDGADTDDTLLVVHLDYGDGEHGYIAYELPASSLDTARGQVAKAHAEWSNAAPAEQRTIEDFIDEAFAAAGVRAKARDYDVVDLSC